MSCGISSRFQLLSPSERQVPHALLTRPPLSSPSVVRKLLPVILVRLACVKHAASVRPEPGSNSPNKNKNVKAQKNQPTKQGQPAIPTKNTQKQKTGIKKQTNTLSSSQTTPTRSSTHEWLACFRKAFRAMFPRPELLASFAAVRRNKENNTHFSRHRQIKQARVMSRDFSA